MPSLDPLLGRTLVLVAHPDDEAIGCGVLLQRIADPIMVFATDGSPEDDYFWKKYGSRQKYAAIRREEAQRAMAAVGVKRLAWLEDADGLPFTDQTLFRRIPDAFQATRKLVDRLKPDVILASAYEGGHPDHDSCCFLAAQVGQRLGIPVWEMPLYHRDEHGKGVLQRFLCATGEEVEVEPTPEEAKRKRTMCKAYVSQGILGLLDRSGCEYFRPMAEYDFTDVPHEGRLNYEIWQWPMTGRDVARSFAEYLGSGFPIRKAS